MKKKQKFKMGHMSYVDDSRGGIEFRTYSDEDSLEIGKFCSIAARCIILGGGEHNPDWVTTYPIRVFYNMEGAFADGQPKSRGTVVLENDVWVGSYEVTCNGGERICHNTVLKCGRDNCKIIVKGSGHDAYQNSIVYAQNIKMPQKRDVRDVAMRRQHRC